MKPTQVPVKSEKGKRDYIVNLITRTCTCPSYHFGRKPCKHYKLGLIAWAEARIDALRTDFGARADAHHD